MSDSEVPKIKAVDLIHGDHSLARLKDVAPPISVSTTFVSPDNEYLGTDFDPLKPVDHVYSRYTQDTSGRVESILSKINGGFAITYSSGLTAVFSALLHFKPKTIAVSGGYMGSHSTFQVFKKLTDVKIIEIDDEFDEGTLCWLETPLNPTGESRNIQHYADKVHAAKGKLVVDATFGPPPLQYPFKWGADCVMHSGTKYFGGHSDLLCGILVVKTEDEWRELHHNRTYTGTMMGSLESWLLLRSLRTLHLRVPRQAATATALAEWLEQLSKVPRGQTWDGVPGGLIHSVQHSKLQARTASWNIAKQMEGGWNATFSILLTNAEQAARVVRLVNYLVPATSLGGVESLIEHRVRADPATDPRLVRISVGVEDIEDLKGDFRQALNRLEKEKAKL